MSGGYTQASLNLSPEEKRVYGGLFKEADSEGLNVVTGDVAVKFFERTKLDPGHLAQIWQIADADNKGFLQPPGFSVALRLIGHCQAGREPSESLATQRGPLPRFDGAAGSPAPASPIVAQNSGSIRIPPLTPDRVQEYSVLFERSGARNGYIGGDAARSVLERQDLPNETLGRIWNLADSEQRGALNLTEWVIAMHLITSMKNGSLRAIPERLPPDLYKAASRRPPQAPASRSIGPQYTGQGPQRTQSPLARPPQLAPQPMSSQGTGSDWLVTPQDKARFDQLFNQLDTNRAGHITGDQAVVFLGKSGLSEDILAQIWDLADIRSEGQLNRDEFAVAMYLVKEERSKTVNRGSIPSTLPPQLIPPSMRQKVIPPSQPTAPAFDNAAIAQPPSKSAADDLFGLDALSNESPSQSAPQEAPRSPPATQRSLPPMQPQSTGFAGMRQFQPTSSFGQSLGSQQPSGASQAQQQSRGLPQQQSANDDLLGDNDADISSKLTNDTAELGNMSNQLGTLRTQMSEVQGKRSTTENELSTTSNQKRELETRLTQFRSQYEQEIREVKALEDRLRVSKAETQQLQQQIAMIEGAHADLQTKHKEVATALDADQRENSTLKERTQRLNAEIAQLKPQLEKMRTDARQQKGLVAINKKQLATSEAEKEKHDREMAELEQEKIRLQQEATASREISRQASPVVSPAMSTTSNTNPFFRRAGSSGTDRVMSPSNFAAPDQDRNVFDNFFGPSEPSSQPAQPPPTTSFRTATPANQYEATPSQETTASPFETPRSAEPPPPPVSQQITSNALPLRPMISESRSSSVMPNPPASRSGDSSIDTPIQAAGTPADSVYGDTARSVPAPTSAPVTTGAVDTDITPTNTREAESTAQPEQTADEAAPTPSLEGVPGAFPGDSSNASTPTTEASERDRGLPTSSSNGNQLLNGATSAFDSVPAAQPKQTGSATEFPPIQEHGADDDDSDSSASEQGFEDDFAPSTSSAQRDVTGATSVTTESSQPMPPQPLGPTDTLPIPKPDVAEISSATTSQLPTPRTEQSPPSYERAMPDEVNSGGPREANQFPREYGDLLPSREITHSPPQEVPQSPPAALTAMSPQSSRQASAAPPEPPQLTSASESVPAPTARAPVDDFDSAFDDLSEAKQDDSDVFGSSTRSDYEFNPTFDSPAPSQATNAETPRHQPTSSFDSAFGASGATPFSTSTSQPAQQGSSHDWDDLFSGLNTSSTATNGHKDPFDLGGQAPATGFGEVREGPAPTYGALQSSSSQAPTSQAEPFTTTSSFSPFSNSTSPTNGTSRRPPRLSPSPSASQRNFAAPTSPPPRDTAPSPQYAPPSEPPPGRGSSLRPAAPARAVSQGTEHDDPILKTLTGMGYDREASVKALEKYDYNIDMAADHLASNA